MISRFRMSVKFFSSNVSLSIFPAMLRSIITVDESLEVHVKSNNYAEILNYFSNNMDKILSYDDYVELSNVLSVAISYLQHLSTKDLYPVALHFIQSFSKYSNEKIDVKVPTLQLIFNTLPEDSTARFYAFTELLTTLIATKSTQLFTSYTTAEKWLENWSSADYKPISNNDRANTYLLLSTIVQQNEILGDSSLAAKYTFEYLSLASNPDTKLVASQVAESLKLPSIKACFNTWLSYPTLLSQSCVKSLTGNDAVGVKLLQILSSGTWSEYKAFISTPQATAYLTQYNIPIFTITNNMSSLILASTFAAGKTYSYKQVGQALDLQDDLDVEEYVVEAASAGHIDAKINQKESTVRFESVYPRTLESYTIDKIRERINTWRSTMNTTLTQAEETFHKNSTL